MDRYRVKLTLTEPILGSVPKDKDVYETYVASLAPDNTDDEMDTVQEAEERGWTGFHRLDDGTFILYDYVFKGFMKSACYFMKQAKAPHSEKLAAYKKKIDGLVFVFPRRVPLIPPEPIDEPETLSRSLRAQTPRGERTALAKSDTLPVGTTIEFDVEVLGAITEAMLREWFTYGSRMGLGQWRSGSYGRFEYEMEKL